MIDISKLSSTDKEFINKIASIQNVDPDTVKKVLYSALTLMTYKVFEAQLNSSAISHNTTIPYIGEFIFKVNDDNKVTIDFNESKNLSVLTNNIFSSTSTEIEEFFEKAIESKIDNILYK